MRLRIRGPSGQSTIALDELATVATLKKSITTETSLSTFDIKYGYPPKPLSLDQYPHTKLLSELEVKLNGEQLIISQTGTTSPEKIASSSGLPMSNLSSKPKMSPAGPSRDREPAIPAAQRPESTLSPTKSGSAAPLSLSRKDNPEMSDPPEIFLPELGGTLVLRIMPDDNSCLFRAVASAIMPDLDTMNELRSIVAQTIQANSDKYTKVVLDNKDPDAYCAWIQTEDAWGGQIELDILSQQFDTEICSIDVQTLRVDKYNEDAPRRCILVYSGIHYDTIALSISGLPPEEDVKQFEMPISDEVLPQAVNLCRKLREKHYYTDTAAFKLQCGDCGALCTGESGATEHASQTGHYNFGEAS